MIEFIDSKFVPFYLNFCGYMVGVLFVHLFKYLSYLDHFAVNSLIGEYGSEYSLGKSCDLLKRHLQAGVRDKN